jgi:hypothetical protein
LPIWRILDLREILERRSKARLTKEETPLKHGKRVKIKEWRVRKCFDGKAIIVVELPLAPECSDKFEEEVRSHKFS